MFCCKIRLIFLVGVGSLDWGWGGEEGVFDAPVEGFGPSLGLFGQLAYDG